MKKTMRMRNFAKRRAEDRAVELNILAHSLAVKLITNPEKMDEFTKLLVSLINAKGE